MFFSINKGVNVAVAAFHRSCLRLTSSHHKPSRYPSFTFMSDVRIRQTHPHPAMRYAKKLFVTWNCSITNKQQLDQNNKTMI